MEVLVVLDVLENHSWIRLWHLKKRYTNLCFSVSRWNINSCAIRITKLFTVCFTSGNKKNIKQSEKEEFNVGREHELVKKIHIWFYGISPPHSQYVSANKTFFFQSSCEYSDKKDSLIEGNKKKGQCILLMLSSLIVLQIDPTGIEQKQILSASKNWSHHKKVQSL